MAERNTAGQPLGHGELSDLDRRILDLLSVYQTTAGAWPRLRTLAERLGVTRRHVRRRLAALEAAGHVTRQQTWERGDDPGWAVRGLASRQPGRQTSNLYVLGPLGHGEMRKPSSTPRTRPESCPTSKPWTDHKPVVGTTPGTDHGTTADVLGVEPWPVDDTARFQPVAFHVPEVDRLDHDPSAGELLATLRAGLGEAQVLEVRPNGPATPVYATARGRAIDLERCPPADLHRAVDQLDRDTCVNGGCRRGEPCPRHQRRRRAR